MPKFNTIYERALRNKGSEDELLVLLPKVSSAAELKRQTDAWYLSQMVRRVFCSGFVWKIIDAKWAGFEQAFHGFDPYRVAMMSDEELENLTRDTRIVRHYRKIMSVRDNAIFVLEVAEKYGSVGNLLAQWPEQDIVGLWGFLKKHGSRLGGRSGSYFLRFAGKDTFLLSRDVVACLNNHGIIDNPDPTAKRDLATIQNCFNNWQEETGLPLAHLSRIASISVG